VAIHASADRRIPAGRVVDGAVAQPVRATDS
jgi:hypothetical protein